MESKGGKSTFTVAGKYHVGLHTKHKNNNTTVGSEGDDARRMINGRFRHSQRVGKKAAGRILLAVRVRVSNNERSGHT